MQREGYEQRDGGRKEVGAENRKQSRVAEVQKVRTEGKAGNSQVMPGLISHGKEFRSYTEGNRKPLKYSKQGS